MENNYSRRAAFRIGAGTAATVGLMGLAGCTATSSPGSTAKPASTLRVGTPSWKNGDSIDPTTGRKVVGLDTILSKFEKPNNSTVTVTNISTTSANSLIAKTQTLLLGNQVDVIEGNTLWPFYEQGLLEDLTPYIKRDNWKSKFVPSVLAPPNPRFTYPPYSPNPKIYLSVPGDLQAPSLAYDKQLFKDFDVEPLSKIPTIKEIIEKAPKLTGKNPRTGKDCYGIGYDPRATAHTMLYYLGQGVDLGSVDPKDPSKLTLDTPAVKRGIEEMIALAKYCPPGFDIGQGRENWGTKDNTVAINMVVSSPDMYSAIQNGLAKRYVVTEGLRDKAGHTFLVTGQEWAMAKNTKDKDAAWELIKFLSGPVTQKLAWDNTLDLPSWKAANWVDTKQAPYAPAFLAAGAAAKNAFFPQFMFTDFRPWIAAQVSLAGHGSKPDIVGGLAEMQQKGEAWVKTQTMAIG